MKTVKLLSILLICFLSASTFAGNKPDKEVLKAFDLRMNGKVDEAKVLLEQILTKDSTNAMAHYEMARIKHYMLVGGGGTKIDDIVNSIDKAVQFDPKNVTYAYYCGIAKFLKSFIAMQTGQQDQIKNNIAETCKQFEKVLTLKPDYCEPMLYLVEIYGMLPPDMGGDSLKAQAWAAKLAKTDSYFGARAKADLLPESADREKFWKDQIALKGRTPNLLSQAGIACLFKDDPENAEKYFNEAIKSDPKENIRILDLGRYHMMQAMQNKDLAGTELPIAKSYFEKYLQTKPEPVVPMKAYTIGVFGIIDMIQGNQAGAEKMREEAKALDKYFSKATGVPEQILFEPPDEICHHFSSFFMPY